jgi:hypothetical protein
MKNDEEDREPDSSSNIEIKSEAPPQPRDDEITGSD